MLVVDVVVMVAKEGLLRISGRSTKIFVLLTTKPKHVIYQSCLLSVRLLPFCLCESSSPCCYSNNCFVCTV